jgi:hypothetical protein
MTIRPMTNVPMVMRVMIALMYVHSMPIVVATSSTQSMPCPFITSIQT